MCTRKIFPVLHRPMFGAMSSDIHSIHLNLDAEMYSSPHMFSCNCPRQAPTACQRGSSGLKNVQLTNSVVFSWPEMCDTIYYDIVTAVVHRVMKFCDRKRQQVIYFHKFESRQGRESLIVVRSECRF